ncbi:sarcalumenin [Melitaea cinxia]|uniref:sarcalumenin n=1 Tax=Melitaea cinxia TaxID=113334 RepID=UPI001E274589|nr:sarcalumenin [Melitaea cinxia]XP_045454446.1 sarcalumenin [Melitaea cinxia]XP_045454447.1 sarcalumenin [Melitaea cinxia]XP_045454448.1 sarcalumenin [Melitaea cinxia]XP_045454449.1 sarcalumenin [Melitaea cinxia]XP_045454450.1 sarcalumenin [Melitaea cinxia]XP_045454451.1 sarcalumenin [Melitaea cinxia]XP_045454452.1 sarcalumenin [Melitaea cinxia]
MWTKRLKLWRFMLCMLFAVSALALAARADDDIPSESQCRPYIEKALKELESGDSETDSKEKNESSEVNVDDETKEDTSVEDIGIAANSDGNEEGDSKEDENSKEEADSKEKEEDLPSVEVADEPYLSQVSYEDESAAPIDADSKEDATVEASNNSEEKETAEIEEGDKGDSVEQASAEDQETEKESGEVADEISKEDSGDSKEDSKEQEEENKEGEENKDVPTEKADTESKEVVEKESEERTDSEVPATDDMSQESDNLLEKTDVKDAVDESEEDKKSEEDDGGSQEKAESKEVDESVGDSQEEKEEESKEQMEEDGKSEEAKSEEAKSDEEQDESTEKDESAENEIGEDRAEESQAEESAEDELAGEAESEEDSAKSEETGSDEAKGEGAPEEDLLLIGEIPENLRSRDHIIKILRLDEEASESELIIEKSADIVLRDLKRLYENSIKPLEALYKYRDLSNRHFGDPEIFSKPLVLFMGPWSGGKSSILNYLTGIEFTEWSLRTGAEPSPAYFNILMHGKDPEVLDGTQLAADWTFSGLQKFGQGLEERLRGLRYPSKLLEKVNIVEIPGILEVRKQVSRVFPFNDACQWFIDRADIIFLVYDPSKLDVGPETEAILDQLKGRESQTRIVLNKADTVKPEELMRVQSALIWNISPLMSSPQPPVMYTVSLWSLPFEPGAPSRLLLAQERELLRDLRQAIDKRIENKIASARRFAVRVRNHAKMVDCYLTTYYNHKTIFGNKKLIADAIIENPQNYHIYEGLSTLTNISRYDLPDPETYRDFFRLNPLYEFQQLSATCTYFRGCPITRLDVAIAYDLPELVGKYKKMVETATPQGMPKS